MISMLICVYPQPVVLDNTPSFLMTNVFSQELSEGEAHSDHTALPSMIKSYDPSDILWNQGMSSYITITKEMLYCDILALINPGLDI